MSTLSPTLPADCGTAISDLTKTLQTLLAETRANAQRDNDLIYNAVPTPEATLPVIDKMVVATAIPIQEVYSAPDVQKVIGPDMFVKLVPLSVHESASVYSEEKAKVVRKEVEACDAADEELRVGLQSLGLPGALKKWKDALAGEGGEGGRGVPQEVEVWADEIESAGGIQGIETLCAQLDSVKAAVGEELSTIRSELDAESRECEAMRVRDVTELFLSIFTCHPRSGTSIYGLRSLLVAFRGLSARNSSHIRTLSQQLHHLTRRSAHYGRRSGPSFLCFYLGRRISNGISRKIRLDSKPNSPAFWTLRRMRGVVAARWTKLGRWWVKLMRGLGG